MNCDAVNDDVDIIDPLLGFMCVGLYDKTGVQIGHIFSIYGTARQSTQLKVTTGDSVQCGDDDNSSENITSSATL